VIRPRFAFLDHPGPIPFAHRGGALEEFENTWKSFAHARDLGYQYLETDVNATLDGVALAIHDPFLQRVSDRHGLVRELTWHELSTVRLDGNEPIPRLDELLHAWPEARWNIDVKHDTAVDSVVATLRRTDAVDRVCITTFSDRRLTRVRRALGPTLCTALGPAAVGSLRLASMLPPAAAGPMIAPLARFGAAQVPVRRGRVVLVDERFVRTAHQARLHVHVWTVNDEATMSRLLDLGVDGIMTDRPSALKRVLEARRLWR
jgi:glycerophosphoryl diester phosphodiesterase